MSIQLFQQILHMQENLLVFTLQFSKGNFEPLIYRILGRDSIFTRSTCAYDKKNILVDISALQEKDLFRIIDLVQTLLQHSGQSWPYNHDNNKIVIQKAVKVVDYTKVIHYAMFIQDGILPNGSAFQPWEIKLNYFYGAPKGSVIYTPLQLPKNNFLQPY